MDYRQFLSELDARLEKYFNLHKQYICCKEGCSSCCEKGDYPISSIELEYLMQGFINLDDETKRIVQSNIKKNRKGRSLSFFNK